MSQDDSGALRERLLEMAEIHERDAGINALQGDSFGENAMRAEAALYREAIAALSRPAIAPQGEAVVWMHKSDVAYLASNPDDVQAAFGKCISPRHVPLYATPQATPAAINYDVVRAIAAEYKLPFNGFAAALRKFQASAAALAPQSAQEES